MSHTSSTAMAKIFSKNRGKALAISWLGLSLGEGILPGLVIYFLNVLLWKKIWLLIASFLILFVFPLIIFLLKNHKDNTVHLDEQKINIKIKHWTRKEVLKDFKFYFLLPAVLCPPFLITGIFINQIYLFENANWSLNYLAISFTAYAVFTILSLQISGYLIDKFSAIKILPFYLIPMILGFIISILFKSILSPIIFFIFIAVTNGTANVLMTSTWSEIYGTKNLGAIRSVTISLMVFSTALSPVLFGLLIDFGMTSQKILLYMLIYALFSNLLLIVKMRSYKPIIIA
jgi:MFS family permease